MEEILINFGSDIKSLGDNKIGGYLVRYSTATAPDLANEFFTKDTDFGFDDSIKTPIYLNHRLPLKIPNGKEIVVKKKIGEGVLTKDDDGVLIEAILYTRKQYEKALSVLGWSSGTARHLVDREQVGKAYHITTWPLGLDASLTPEPCDPNNICTLKSYPASLKASEIVIDEIESDEQPAKAFKQNALASTLTRHIDDRIDDGHDRESIIKSLSRESGLDVEQVESILTGESNASVPNLKAFARALRISFDALAAPKQRDYAKTIKGMFAQALADQTPSRWQLDSIYADIVRKLATTAQASVITGVDFDVEAKIKEATSEYMERLQNLAIGQVSEYVESGSDEPFYLKAIIDLKTDLPVSEGLNLEDHSQLAVSALRDVIKRFRANHEARQREGNNHKAGRVLSQANRTRLGNMLEQIQTAVSDCQKLLDESQPMATDEEKSAGQMEHLRLQHIELTQRIDHPTGV